MKKCVIAVLVLCLMESSVLFGVNTKRVPVPRPIVVGGVLPESYDNTELLNFAELIKEQVALRFPYIIARVTTFSGDKQMIHYFDAHAINQQYGPYPFQERIAVNIRNNPKNRQPIQKIQYFTINSPDEPSFEYLGSDADVLGTAEATRVKRMLYVNQDTDSVLATETYLQLGDMYYSGQGVDQDYDKARSYYEQAIVQPDDNPRAKVYARMRLGEIDANPASVAQARMLLGDIYYLGKGVHKDYARARSYYEQVVGSPQDDLWSTARARVQLGWMYHFGRGVARNYEKAHRYYEQVVARPQDNARATAKARLYLGEMYYLGEGVDKDYGKARSYYEQVMARPEDNPNAIPLAQERLAELDQEEAAAGQVLGKRQQEEEDQGGPSDVKRRRGMGDDDQE